MLQKILVVLVGLVMSLVGALSPSGLFASDALPDVHVPAAAARDETLATVRVADGAAFARVSVLWVEVDGRRVTEDAWGAGVVDHLRFKVGAKGVEGLSLALGDRLVPLRPTDVLTVRMFSGDFAFREIGTAKATLQLEGVVKSASVLEGDVDTRVRTEAAGGEAPASRPGDARRLAYAVLDTGEKVDTVSLETGGARLFTEEAPSAQQATALPGNLLAKWVKVDGRLVDEYTWGDGVVGLVEFEPADAGKGGVVLAFDGKATDARAGTRVLVKDFVGEYLVYQVAGGLVRLRLDGYAAETVVGASGSVPVQTGAGAPIASFTYLPASPKTTDTITFTDESQDDTLVVFRMWRFGDQGTSVLRNPTFRFTTPGDHTVTLNVTDTDRQTSETSVVIRVGNADPVPDFDFWPKIVTTDTWVSFTDHSHDHDGQIVNRTWDFGDGEMGYGTSPAHRFRVGGPATVRLTTTDDLGAVSSIDKIVNVRNAPPVAQFSYAPSEVTSLVPVQFTDLSEDRDGGIVEWSWSFGDGGSSALRFPVHEYLHPGIYTVSLTVTDTTGDSDTTTEQILVQNRLPHVDFTWSPNGATADKPVLFTSLANDLDGEIKLHEWEFGDGTRSLDANPVHFFPRAGRYMVTLTVVDDRLGTNITGIEVGIANSLPRAQMSMNPNPVHRGVEVTFADLSSDPDGDPIVNRTWTFQDGTVAYTQVVRHVFNSLGPQNVTLRVVDAQGSVGHATSQVQVKNRPPVTLGVSTWPPDPTVKLPVFFDATAIDLDAQAGDAPLEYEFRFSDDVVVRGPSRNVSRVFDAPTEVGVVVRSFDAQLDPSQPVTTRISVTHPRPLTAFSWSPSSPAPVSIDDVVFTDSSSVLDGHITDRRWDFKDGTVVTTQEPTVAHAFATGGTYFVNLTVTDNRSTSAYLELPVFVNGRPVAEFSIGHPRPGQPTRVGDLVTFEDQSSDTDPGGRIVTRSWSFDDGAGSSSSVQDPSWRFRTPGTHQVTLTVTDDLGGQHTRMKEVVILNRPPVPSWTGPLDVRANVPTTYTSTSTDPDNTSIVAHYWEFGDGTTATGPVVTHAWTSTGPHTVTLVVNDGETNSSRLAAGAAKRVRVASDHDAIVDVRAVLPNGDPADLVGAGYVVRARLGGTPLPASYVLTNGSTDLAIRLPAGEWIRNDVVSVFLDGPGLFSGTLSRSYVLADADGRTRSILLEFEIPLPLKPVVTPQGGEQDTFETMDPVVPNDDETSQGHVVYRSMQESFRGVGRVAFADGTPVWAATVTVEARYVPFTAVAPVRSLAPLSDNDVIGWCRAASVTTAMDGTYSWVLDHRSGCFPDQANLHPAGRWEIRAKAAYEFAETGVSDVAVIYVDPTGGLLWAAGAPP